MKILLIADNEESVLWGAWTDKTKEMLSDVGLILSAGDLSPYYLEYLVTMLNVPLVYVRGNHDGLYYSRPPEGCICAEESLIEAEGIRILGLGGSMRYKPDAADMYTEAEMQKRIRYAGKNIRKKNFYDWFMGTGGLQRGFDILLTHAPCRGFGDMEDLPHTGFECFNSLLDRYKPRIHCYGHVHEEYGHFRRKISHPSGAILINGSGHYIIDWQDKEERK